MLQSLTEKERTRVVDILVNYWKERGMPQYGVKWAEDYLMNGHKKEVKRDEFFVYNVDDEVIGTISLVTDVSDVAEIRDMVVKPEYRGKGYGKKMLNELIKLAKERHLRKLFALTKIEGIFKSAGFEKEGVLKNHFTEGEDLIIMSKFLQ